MDTKFEEVVQSIEELTARRDAKRDEYAQRLAAVIERARDAGMGAVRIAGHRIAMEEVGANPVDLLRRYERDADHNLWARESALLIDRRYSFGAPPNLSGYYPGGYLTQHGNTYCLYIDREDVECRNRVEPVPVRVLEEIAKELPSVLAKWLTEGREAIEQEIAALDGAR